MFREGTWRRRHGQSRRDHGIASDLLRFRVSTRFYRFIDVEA